MAVPEKDKYILRGNGNQEAATLVKRAVDIGGKLAAASMSAMSAGVSNSYSMTDAMNMTGR